MAVTGASRAPADEVKSSRAWGGPVRAVGPTRDRGRGCDSVRPLPDGRARRRDGPARRLAVVEVARDGALLDEPERRLLAGAPVHHVRAPRVEAAAGRWLERARHL